MERLIIKNARVVLPDTVLEKRNVLIENGKICDLDYKNLNDTLAELIDADGNYLFAGFIDLHVHGGGGADFMDASPKAFETAVSAHLKHGTTLLYPTALAAPFEELKCFLECFNKFKEDSSLSKLTPGVHLEGPYFFGGNQTGRGAQKVGALRKPDMDEVEKLLAISNGSIKRWDAAPELEGADIFGRRMKSEGILCAVAHTDATAEETEIAFDNGFSHVTHFYNANSMHRKREQTVFAGVVEATYLNDNVTVELIGDGCHIPKQDIYLAIKIKGVENVSIISDAMRIAGTDMKSGKLGNIETGTDVIVDEDVAKLTDKASFAGSIATMDRCLRVLNQKYGIDLPTASVLLSLAPAIRMGISANKGSIEVGKDADLLIIDKALTVKKVIVGGSIMEI